MCVLSVLNVIRSTNYFTRYTLISYLSVVHVGVVGIQWKTRFGKSCHVTITERDETCIQSIMGNSMSNGLVPKPFVLEFSRIPGLPFELQELNEICVKQCDVRVMLHMEAFDFM